MPNCPQCSKPLREFTRRCPSCQADLDLLVDYVSHLQGGLQRAENLVKAGELGQAIWAYLEVLEVDPDNPTARKQIAQVVTAVRQFDGLIPGRRWANGLPPELPSGKVPWWQLVVVGLGCLVVGGLITLAIVNVDWANMEWPTMPPMPIEHKGAGPPPALPGERPLGGK